MKHSAWALVVLGVAVGAGAAIAFDQVGLAIALVVALFVVVAATSFAGRSPKRRERSVARAKPRTGITKRPTLLAPARIGSNTGIRRALGAATMVTLFIIAADTQFIFGGGSSSKRYVLLIIPVFALLGASAAGGRSRLAPTTVADRYLAVYVLCGLVGSIAGRAFYGTVDSGTAIFIPMSLGLTHLLVTEPTTAPEAERYQRILIRVCLVFLVLGILSETGLWIFATPIVHAAHERVFFVAMGVTAAILSWRYGMAALLLAMAVFMFFLYPAATWVIVAIAAVATGFATSRRGKGYGAAVLIVFLVGLIGFGFTQVQSGQSSIAKSYFASVNKTDNTGTRSQLWKAAELKIERSPWVGSMFTGNFTVDNVDQVITDRPAGFKIEPHNDYLEVLILGGFFGLFLFGGFIISTNVIVTRRVHALYAQGADSQGKLARILLIGFNAVLISAFFNPELSQTGIGASAFLIYALMMTVRPSPTRPDDLAELERTARLPAARSRRAAW